LVKWLGFEENANRFLVKIGKCYFSIYKHAGDHFCQIAFFSQTPTVMVNFVGTSGVINCHYCRLFIQRKNPGDVMPEGYQHEHAHQPQRPAANSLRREQKQRDGEVQ